MKTKLPVIILSVLLIVCLVGGAVFYNQQTSTIKSLEDSESMLKGQVKDLESDINDLNANVTEKEATIAELNADNDKLKDKQTVLEDTIAQTNEYLDYELSLKEKWTTYISPEDIIGEWSVITFVRAESAFDTRTAPQDYWLKSVKFNTDTAKFYTKDGSSSSMPWIDDHIVSEETAMGYRIEKIDDKEYMFLEWKVGDYTRDNQIPYYVLERK